MDGKTISIGMGIREIVELPLRNSCDTSIWARGGVRVVFPACMLLLAAAED